MVDERVIYVGKFEGTAFRDLTGDELDELVATTYGSLCSALKAERTRRKVERLRREGIRIPPFLRHYLPGRAGQCEASGGENASRSDSER